MPCAYEACPKTCMPAAQTACSTAAAACDNKRSNLWFMLSICSCYSKIDAPIQVLMMQSLFD